MNTRFSNSSVKVLLLKAKTERRLNPSDLALVADYLQSTDSMEVSTAVFIVGYLDEQKFLPNLVVLLEKTKDEIIAGEILYVISRHFGKSSMLRSFVLEYLTGKNARFLDITGELLRKCLLASGDILAENPADKALLSEVVKRFSDSAQSHSIRDEAYRSLQRADGFEVKALAPSSRILSSGDIDDELVRKMKSKLN